PRCRSEAAGFSLTALRVTSQGRQMEKAPCRHSRDGARGNRLKEGLQTMNTPNPRTGFAITNDEVVPVAVLRNRKNGRTALVRIDGQDRSLPKSRVFAVEETAIEELAKVCAAKEHRWPLPHGGCRAEAARSAKPGGRGAGQYVPSQAAGLCG